SFWFRRLEHSMGSFVGVLLICHFKKGLHSRRWISPTPESVDPFFTGQDDWLGSDGATSNFNANQIVVLDQAIGSH
ncbi:hypothetical protein, partial [Lacticaseibacillus sp. GG6-2]